jgi:hypothetical protein
MIVGKPTTGYTIVCPGSPKGTALGVGKIFA